MRMAESKIGLLICLVMVLPFALSSYAVYAQRTVTEGASAELLPSHKAVSYPNNGPNGTTPPIFSHGLFIQFKRYSESAEEANIYLYDSMGNMLHRVNVWPPAIVRLHLISADVDANSRLWLAGEQTKADGTKSPFIATSKTDGSHLQFFNTEGFLATHISVAADGSVWGIGAERMDGNTDSVKKRNYDTLRHYSASGELLDHFIPRWGQDTAYVVQQVDESGRRSLRAYDRNDHLLTTYAAPFFGPQGGYGPKADSPDDVCLTTVDNDVILYDGRSGFLFQYGTAQQTSTRTGVNIHESDQSWIAGFAVTSDRRIFANFRPLDVEHPKMAGLFELVLPSVRGLAEWSRVRIRPNMTGTVSEQVNVILGSDKTDIVYKAAGRKVHWAEVN